MFIIGSSGPAGHAKLRTYEEGYMLPVLMGDDLLFGSRHKGVMRQLQDLINVPENHFDIYYKQLFYRFFEFVQVLPRKQNGILGSMLNYGLARAIVAIQKFMQQKEIVVTPLLKYAVFSAALLKDVGRVLSQQRITLVNHDGDFISDWNPFSGPMTGQAEYYKIYQISQSYLRVESEVTPMLARQIIPKDAFLWLSSDIAVFSDWLAALLDEEGVAAKQITWALGLIRRDDLIAILSTLDGALVNTEIPQLTEHAEEFYKWLKEGLESGEISINEKDSAIFIVKEGVFLDKKIFKRFVDITNSPVNFQIVYTQFGNLMGIPKKSGDDFLNAQYFTTEDSYTVKSSAFSGALTKHSPKSFCNGMLLSDPGLILMNAQVPATTHLLKAAQPKTPEFHKQPLTKTQTFDQTNALKIRDK